MCNLSYGIRQEGRQEGLAEGRNTTLYELVSKGLLVPQVAAQEAGQTDEEFQEGLNAWLAQRASA